MLSCCFRARVKIEKATNVNTLFMIAPGLGNQDTGDKHDVVKRRMLCKSSYISSSLKTAYRKPHDDCTCLYLHGVHLTALRSNQPCTPDVVSPYTPSSPSTASAQRRSARLQDDLSKVVCHADPIIVFNIPLNSAYQVRNKENGPLL